MAQTLKVSGVATKIYTTEDGYTHVRYHSTNVVSFSDREIVLRTGGWSSATTKLRMNQASSQFDLGFTVFQKDFKWFIEYQDVTLSFNSNTVILKR